MFEDREVSFPMREGRSQDSLVQSIQAAFCTACTLGNLEFIIDNNLLCVPLGSEAGLLAGVEEAMLKMNKGEKAHVWIHPGKWGFGAAGKPELGIPGNAGLEYIIHLKTFENVS